MDVAQILRSCHGTSDTVSLRTARWQQLPEIIKRKKNINIITIE